MENKIPFYIKAFLLLFLIVITNSSFASKTFLKKGYILNDREGKCWYTQETDTENRYFHETLTSTVGIITFDDNRCMFDSELGFDITKTLINNVIARWYSHRDAAFKTRAQELFRNSPLQKRGMCIQSEKYPTVGITIDYEIKSDAVVKVIHGMAIQGCVN